MPTKSVAQLSGAHLRAHRTIFQHPISHNLNWREVHELLRAIATVAEEPNGNLTVRRNGQTLVLEPTRTKDVASPEMVMRLRHFLEKSELPEPGQGAETLHWLVVIDHQSAELYRSTLSGAVPDNLLPHEPDKFFRHAHNSRDFSRGQDKPDPNSFFGPIAAALEAPGPILMFGTGTGTGSEMEQFADWLKVNRPGIAARVIGCLTVDSHHMTENELLAKARDHLAGTRGNPE